MRPSILHGKHLSFLRFEVAIEVSPHDAIEIVSGRPCSDGVRNVRKARLLLPAVNVADLCASRAFAFLEILDCRPELVAFAQRPRDFDRGTVFGIENESERPVAALRDAREFYWDLRAIVLPRTNLGVEV